MSNEDSGLIDADTLRPAAPVDTDPVVVDTERGGAATVRR
jgi:hypothetical protein